MNITDLITDRLLELLNEQGGTALIQRNDLAGKLGCVPSQINYVITSRFTQAQGYIVESRRGGGGFIKIVRVDHTKSQLIMNIIHSIGDSLDEKTARILVNSLYMDKEISERDAKLILCVMSDNQFKALSNPLRQEIRANLMKSMLINLI